MKITEVWLFTNRNSIIFDETGEQLVDLQATIGWEPIASYNDHKVHTTLNLIIEDKPVIWLAKWQQWRHEINIDEFCSLIGYGPWYWKTYKKEELTRKISKQIVEQDNGNI